MWLSDENVSDQSGYDPIPTGEYLFEVVDLELKETNKKRDGEAKKGTYVNAHYAVSPTNMHYGNRRVFDIFNIENDSEKAEQIGRGQFRAFLRATGHFEAVSKLDPDSESFLEDLEACFTKMIGSEFTAEVKIVKNTFRDEMENKIKKYVPLESNKSNTEVKKPVEKPLSMDDVPF